MERFFKGIIVGLGGISPGLSGSVLMVLFGLYEKCIEAIGTFFKNPKKNILFLFPLFCGMGVGILTFGKIVSYLLDNYSMQTRFTFLGLVLGTLPLFYKEVTKHGFTKKQYPIIIFAAIFGFLLLNNQNIFGELKELNIMQSIVLGLIVAASTIIPGVDSAVILSALGLYEIYVNAVADVNLNILIPALVGVGFGALLFSMAMNRLIKKYYTITYSVIFGLFISIIPSVIDKSYPLGINIETIISMILFFVGFILSFYLGKKEKH